MTTKANAVNGGNGLNILLTGGRAPAALELARQFADAGHRVFVAESAPYHLCRVSRAIVHSFRVPMPSREPEAFIESLRTLIQIYQIDVLLPTCEEIMYVSMGLSRLQDVCRVFAEPLEVLSRLHNKYAFIRLIEELGLQAPPTMRLSSEADWQRLISSLEDGSSAFYQCRFVLKPVYSRFASQVIILDPANDPDLKNKRLTELIPILSEACPWVAQQFIDGRQICTYSVCHNGSVTAHAAYQTTYRAGLGASIYFEPIEHRGIVDWVKTFAGKLQFTGQLAFDFIETDKGVLYPIECNPRTTSGVHLFGAGQGLVPALLDPASAAGEIALPHPSTRSMLGMAMLSFGLWSSRSLHGWKRWRQDFRRARDVVYRRQDPRPFWEQLRTISETRRISKRQGISLLAATTYDIEWNGDYDRS
ncbi:ATP-grasp domain-containing protein [Paenibacillus spongiae]|uniref:ATP-grasp domain-containing protein n=1 Tax=Paenibacillus spongiae TaxID=2909671 RepID=A0ABY5SJK4_9BACL|nr:ATP-grasp domain-containing protein [Paenibacillus spongiae]UVI32685.1 ATP-grasp domain-containing protein [Paenibacillus spongiae]